VIQWLLSLTFRTFITGWELLCGFGFVDDISVEVLIHDRILLRIRCCVALSVVAYHISGVGKYLGQWMVYESSATTLGAVKNTRVFQTALMALTEPRTL